MAEPAVGASAAEQKPGSPLAPGSQLRPAARGPAGQRQRRDGGGVASARQSQPHANVPTCTGNMLDCHPLPWVQPGVMSRHDISTPGEAASPRLPLWLYASHACCLVPLPVWPAVRPSPGRSTVAPEDRIAMGLALRDLQRSNSADHPASAYPGRPRRSPRGGESVRHGATWQF
jgi:hypothetical protein